MPQNEALQAAGIWRLDLDPNVVTKSCSGCKFRNEVIPGIEDEAIVCRCEQVTARQLKEAAKHANRDMNQVKTATRQGIFDS